ncbi:MAG TPA: 2'-5' RNA ligase family protein [Rubrobacteraceae bacterium]
MEGYAEIWERFKRERRLEFGGHTDPEWQEGHAVSASFVAPIEAPHLREGLRPLRDTLRSFPFVSLHPDHFMHLTLLPLGFLVPKPEDENELSRERLEELGERAREALVGFPAFELDLANLNVFPGAAFVEARDGGMLEKLRDVVCRQCGLEKPTGALHLTLAYLQEADGALAPDEFVAAIERYRNWPVGKISVERVEITLLTLGSSPYPELETFARIPLKG